MDIGAKMVPSAKKIPIKKDLSTAIVRRPLEENLLDSIASMKPSRNANLPQMSKPPGFASIRENVHWWIAYGRANATIILKDRYVFSFLQKLKISAQS